MNPQTVEKLKASVRLCQPGEAPLDGYLCLLPELNGKGRPETILELLNSSRRVIPFLRTSDDAVVLLTRLNIDWVVAGPLVEPAWIMPERYPVASEQAVQLHFVDGRIMEGTVRWPSPGGDVRLSDYLSGPADFYPLLTRLGVVMVNKHRVRETRVP